MRDPTEPAEVRAACHIDGPAAFQAGIPGGSPLDKEVDNQPDTLAVVRAGRMAVHIEDQVGDPFVDQTRCLRAPRLDCLGRGGPRCSMGMRVVAAMLAEVLTAWGNPRGPRLRPNWVLESR